MSDLPKPTLEDAIKRLNNMDEYHVILEYIRGCREGLLRELNADCTPNKIMSIGGGIEALDQLLVDIA